MLELGPKDTLFDLGAGDGRVVLCAAKWFGAAAIGIEVDGSLIEAQLQPLVQKLKNDCDFCFQAAAAHIEAESATVRELTSMRQEDLYSEAVLQDVEKHATAVHLYLIPTALERIRPALEARLSSGTRVLTVGYPLLSAEEAAVGTEWDELGAAQALDLELFAYRKT